MLIAAEKDLESFQIAGEPGFGSQQNVDQQQARSISKGVDRCERSGNRDRGPQLDYRHHRRATVVSVCA
jgi:hypothetical protein